MVANRTRLDRAHVNRVTDALDRADLLFLFLWLVGDCLFGLLGDCVLVLGLIDRVFLVKARRSFRSPVLLVIVLVSAVPVDIAAAPLAAEE